ncbi:MAG: ATP-binding protein, partial [Thermodesulfobacteriota bacterium]|nr:ATP-binding protein [Thermodesulfobacteriota bacterium]
IENGRVYRRVEELNRDLEEKVKERTQQLQHALDEKEKTQEILIRSESLAAIGQLVAGVAHELNNPLASVQSLVQNTVEILEGEHTFLGDMDDVRDDLNFSLKEIRRAGDIVKSLLDVSRQTNNLTEMININLVIKDALRVLYNYYKGKDVTVLEEYQEDIPLVEGNFANLSQVLINIIKNGLESIPEVGGKITITSRHDKEEKKVLIECKDNGHGIPQKLKNEIFKPFFTTKEVGQGTGLGLYIAYEIIKRHKGNLSFESVLGKGTTFTMCLNVAHSI